MEIVPWMMLSAAMRIVAVQGGLVALLSTQASDLALFIAFLLAARRMIELADGTTRLGQLSIAQQFRLGRKVLLPVVALTLTGSAIVYSLGWRWIGLHMLLGFDGIAFDQQTIDGFFWSAFLAAVTLLLVLRFEATGNTNLFAVLNELWQRSLYMAPAIAAVGVVDIGLSIAQGAARGIVYAFWHSSAAPSFVRAMAFYSFVFGFASVRLLITLAILVFALRESYRRGPASPSPGATQT
jgi:hypothetical protein